MGNIKYIQSAGTMLVVSGPQFCNPKSLEKPKSCKFIIKTSLTVKSGGDGRGQSSGRPSFSDFPPPAFWPRNDLQTSGGASATTPPPRRHGAGVLTSSALSQDSPARFQKAGTRRQEQRRHSQLYLHVAMHCGNSPYVLEGFRCWSLI